MTQLIYITWLVGMFVLLPVETVRLPLGITLVDLWTVGGLPVIWLSIPRAKHTISLYYVLPLWLIFTGSFISTFAALAPRNGIIVIVKELFVVGWIVTVTVVLVRLNPRDFRRVLLVWAAVVFLHGLVILAQFVSPEFWRVSAELLGRGADYEIYRPSGFNTNANGAGLFQLLGFVPLILLRPSRNIGILLGALLLTTIVATGSMASMLSLTAGTLVALAVLVLRGKIDVIIRLFASLVIAATILGTGFLFVTSQNQRYQDHLEQIIFGRAERSSSRRFDLWQRGLDVFAERSALLWGIGPENFRVVDGGGNQLHNDFLAFLVERGLVSTAGLGLFAALAMLRALNLYLLADAQRHKTDSERYTTGAGPPAISGLGLIIFLVIMIAALVFSLTHQIFHSRELWIVLSVQEALYFQHLRARSQQSATQPMRSVALPVGR